MAVAGARRKSTAAIGWIATLVGLLALIAGGFVLGLVVGVISEEPELVVGHMAGRTQKVAWASPDASGPDGLDADSTPDVAAGVPAGAARERTASPPRNPSPPPAGPAPRYQIQVGAFADSSSAQGVAGHLRAGGYPVRILEPSDDDRWRVRVGPVEGRDEADRVARRLKSEEQLPTWVLREQDS